MKQITFIWFLLLFIGISKAQETKQFTDKRDKQTYTIEKHGDNWWLLGLKYKGAKHFEDYKTKNLAYTAKNLATAIPTGWRIPTIEEWETFLASIKSNGADMKEVLYYDGNRQYWTTDPKKAIIFTNGYKIKSFTNPAGGSSYLYLVEGKNEGSTSSSTTNKIPQKRDLKSVDGKYSDLIKTVNLKGKNFKSVKKEYSGKYDIGYHDELIIKTDTIPAGYWVFLKEGMPKVAKKTTTGAQVSVGLGDVAQFGKALAVAPEIYVWNSQNGNTSNTNSGDAELASNNGSGGITIYFEDNGTYHSFKQFTPQVFVESTPTDQAGAIFKYLEISFRDPKIPYDVKIKIYKPITGPTTLMTKKEAYCELFTVKKGKGKFKNAALDYDKPIKITQFDADKRTISGEFIFDPVMPDDARVKVVFTNISIP